MPAGALSPIVTWSRVLIIADLPSMPRTCRRTAAEVKESALQAHRYVSGLAPQRPGAGLAAGRQGADRTRVAALVRRGVICYIERRSNARPQRPRSLPLRSWRNW